MSGIVDWGFDRKFSAFYGEGFLRVIHIQSGIQRTLELLGSTDETTQPPQKEQRVIQKEEDPHPKRSVKLLGEPSRGRICPDSLHESEWQTDQRKPTAYFEEEFHPEMIYYSSYPTTLQTSV